MPRWFPYLSSLVLPVGTLAFLVTAPHRGYVSWLVVGIAVALGLVDRVGGVRQPPATPARSRRTFDAVLIAVTLVHFASLFALVQLGRAGAFATDWAIGILLMGLTSAFSGGVVAHELVHRRSTTARWLGRLLLWSSLYDHFVVEHLRGHHAKVGTDADPTTARFGETFWAYAARSVPGQFTSAWELGRGAVAVGVVGEMSMLVAIGLAFGPLALAATLAQAIVSGFVVTAVNYFDHWGLRRTTTKIGPANAWDSDALVSHYLLLALPSHADHHVRASRTYDELRLVEESPKLPYGYLRMIVLVLFRGAEVRRLLTAELERRRLGPFALA